MHARMLAWHTYCLIHEFAWCPVQLAHNPPDQQQQQTAARNRQHNTVTSCNLALRAFPQAFANVLKRMLEAAGRGLWQPGEGVLEQLQQMYADLDDQLEGL